MRMMAMTEEDEEEEEARTMIITTGPCMYVNGPPTQVAALDVEAALQMTGSKYKYNKYGIPGDLGELGPDNWPPQAGSGGLPCDPDAGPAPINPGPARFTARSTIVDRSPSCLLSAFCHAYMKHPLGLAHVLSTKDTRRRTDGRTATT